MALDVARYYPTGDAAEAAARAALTEKALGMVGSKILGIAAEVRAMRREGAEICDLTVGDFSPAQFPIPDALREAMNERINAGETNYPPSEGTLELRQAIVAFYERELGVRFPLDAIVTASGARPPLFAILDVLLNPGDTFVYGVPSWNNDYYGYLNGARQIQVPTRPADGFHLTLEGLQPHLSTARVVHLNSPLNPCGTCIQESDLAEICGAIVAENRRREAAGEPALILLYDMVYWMLTFNGVAHHHPLKLAPEIAPYVVYVDAISKNFAATGLRVGWCAGPPYIQSRIKSLLGHVGAWAPLPFQSATARFLAQPEQIREYVEGFTRQVQERLQVIYAVFAQMAQAGFPVEAIPPQGAIYLSVRVDLIGRESPGGGTFKTNEDIRRYLLESGVAVVPFQAFGLYEDTGWFRMSVGAVSVPELKVAMNRLERAIRKAL